MPPIDQEFIDDCPYGPDAMLLDEVLEIDAAQSLIRVRMPTHDALPITAAQRAHPVRYPRHVSGGLMVHMTGIAGFAHVFYLLGLRHRDGWIGYGARIHSARFHALATPGEPLVISCRATQLRQGEQRVLARYELRMHQGETLVYEGDQTAFFHRVHGADGAPSA